MPDPNPYLQRLEGWLDKLRLKTRMERPAPPRSPQGAVYATFHRRMMASTLDALFVMLLMTPFNGWLMQIAYSGMHLDPELVDMALASASTQAEAQMAILKLQMNSGLLSALAMLTQIQYTFMAAYSFFFWHFFSATPGKMLLNLRIVDDKTGEAMSDRQSFIRVLAYMVSGIPLMLGFFAIAWNKKHQGWHDRLARTAVIVRPRAAKVKSTPEAAHPSGSPAPGESE